VPSRGGVIADNSSFARWSRKQGSVSLGVLGYGIRRGETTKTEV